MNTFKKLELVVGLWLGCTLTVSANDWQVTDFGAKADGKTLNTASIQAAIDYVNAQGGGRVVFAPGNYVCGSIYLKSGVTLHLEGGATLLGSTNPWDYAKDPYAKWTALVFAVKQHDIGITGKGTIDGRGFEVANRIVELVHRGKIADKLTNDRPQEDKRPENIHFRECQEVTISGITLKNPASWNQQYDQCTDLLIEDIYVDSKAYWNNDGLDVVDCSNVVIRNCYIDSADDAYCFKSHAAGKESRNVLVENCVARSSASGVKFGTVTRGGFHHFRFRNITVFDTFRSAFLVASVDGSDIDDIEIDGLRSIHTGNPFFIRFAQRNEGKAPCVKDITIKNIYAEVPWEKPDAGYNYEGPIPGTRRNVCPSSILGIPGMRVENVKIQNVEIVYPGRATKDYAFQGCTPDELEAMPEHEKRYPEFSIWGEQPAWGLWIRHADGIELENVKIRLAAPDYRPAIVSDDVHGLTLKNVVIDDPFGTDKEQIITNKTTDFIH